MEEEKTLDALRDACPGAILEAGLSLGDAVAVIRPEDLPAVAAFLRDGPPRMAMLLDLTCVDRPDESGRFEMVYHFLSLETYARVRIKARLPAVNPEIASLTGLWKNADWLEREVFDLFGICFADHPNLSRLLLYDGFEGHPLRKDYPLRRRQPRIPPRQDGPGS
ncbi:MAG: NADH-quinone oxidoreductase subunit C [Candidatus Aminicenantes bacterium]|nr:NADH-quinone oxidoreductase subunit C [Candidatus Aminicenantes bacterium]